jgi:conjugative transfer signal peptidase TraF
MVRQTLGSTRRRMITALPVLLAVLILAAAAMRAAGFELNVTGSLPMGLYRDSGRAADRPNAPNAFRRGAVVIACLPLAVASFGRARGYLPHGPRCPGGVLPIGKVVLAIPGDTVRLNIAGISVNGVAVPNTQVWKRDGHGRPVPYVAPGEYIVAERSLWLGSSFSSASWDSRYYGAIPTELVIAVVRPVWPTAQWFAERATGVRTP